MKLAWIHIFAVLPLALLAQQFSAERRVSALIRSSGGLSMSRPIYGFLAMAAHLRIPPTLSLIPLHWRRTR